MDEDVMWKDFIRNSRKPVSLSVEKIYYDSIHSRERCVRYSEETEQLCIYTLNKEGREWMNVRVRKSHLNKYSKGFICSRYVGYAEQIRRF